MPKTFFKDVHIKLLKKWDIFFLKNKDKDKEKENYQYLNKLK